MRGLDHSRVDMCPVFVGRYCRYGGGEDGGGSGDWALQAVQLQVQETLSTVRADIRRSVWVLERRRVARHHDADGCRNQEACSTKTA